MTNSKLFHLILVTFHRYNAQKIKFSIKEFFSKYDHIRSFLQIWSHLLKKSLMKNFTFCAALSSPALPNHPSIKKNFGNPAPHLNKPVHMKIFDVHNTTVCVCNFNVCNVALWQLIIITLILMSKMLEFFLGRSRNESCFYNRLNGLDSNKATRCLSVH